MNGASLTGRSKDWRPKRLSFFPSWKSKEIQRFPKPPVERILSKGDISEASGVQPKTGCGCLEFLDFPTKGMKAKQHIREILTSCLPSIGRFA